MRQRFPVRGGAAALLASDDQAFALQQGSNGADRRPAASRFIALQNMLELARAPAHMRLPQFQNHALDLFRRLVAMPVRRAAALDQAQHSCLAIAPQPHVPGFARNLKSLTEFGHSVFTRVILQYKAKLFFHNTARFPWHALGSTRPCHLFTVSGILPVCFVRDPPSPYQLRPPPTPPPICMNAKRKELQKLHSVSCRF